MRRRTGGSDAELAVAIFAEKVVEDLHVDGMTSTQPRSATGQATPIRVTMRPPRARRHRRDIGGHSGQI